MTPRLLMIGGWTAIYRTAKRLGYELTVVQEKQSLTAEDYGCIDRVHTAALDAPELVDVFSAVHAHRPFDIVVSFQEMGVLSAAEIGARLGIRSNPLEPVRLTRDKTLMRRHMQEHAIPSIPFVSAADDASVAAFGDAVGWPIILKPNRGAGSAQIHLLQSHEGIAQARAAILQHYPGEVPLAEKFMSGPEISIEAISWQGEHHVLAITDKVTTGAPRFVETGHNMPSRIDAGLARDVAELTVRFLNSIGHQYGPSHSEMILSESGPCIIESHTRTGGDFIFQMVELVHGVDMFEATLRGFLGEFPKLHAQVSAGAAVRYLTPPAGLVERIEGLDAAAQAPGVVRCEISLAAGMRAAGFTSSDERYGCVLAIGATCEEATRNAERALAEIRVGISQSAEAAAAAVMQGKAAA